MGLLVQDVLIPISVAITITIIHLFGEKISSRMKKWHDHLESLGAGLMVGIMFLELLPQMVIGETILKFYIYLPLLAGFVIIALLEKIVYKKILKGNPESHIKLHVNDTDSNLKTEVNSIIEYEREIIDIECVVPEQNAIFEAIALITHNAMIGILISLIFSENAIGISFIIIIPFFIRAFTIGFTTEQIIEDLNDKPEKIFRLLGIITPSLGALLGVFLVYNEVAFFIIFAFALGSVLFSVIRDMIPLGKKGKPIYFLIGVLFTVGIFLLDSLLLST
ncbi:MAG: hypothetical protein JXA54_09295 [Candidatus Heimdallarchaeota archaeon]|nr:hypothetical protein [Candidatus Heimdallarchaeota archaeon]